MEEKSIKRIHGGVTRRRIDDREGILEEESLKRESCKRNHLEKKHLRDIWEASERHLGSIWEASERHLHLGGIWKASGRHLGLQAAMELQEAPNLKNRCPSQLKCKISIKMLILHCVFEGQITK